MGQVESVAAKEDQSSESTSASTPAESSTEPSLDSLLAEASAYGDEDADLSLDEKAQKALECPCIAHLRTGPCGTQFSDAFVCFMKSTAEEKGSDCVNPFVALQSCVQENPDAFSKDILVDDDPEKKEEKPSQEYKIRPPVWSRKSKSPSS